MRTLPTIPLAQPPACRRRTSARKVADVPGAAMQTYSIDVTASLAAWVNDPTANLGWLFTAAGIDGVDARSSEYATIEPAPQADSGIQFEPAADLLCADPEPHRQRQRPGRQPGQLGGLRSRQLRRRAGDQPERRCSPIPAGTSLAGPVHPMTAAQPAPTR